MLGSTSSVHKHLNSNDASLSYGDNNWTGYELWLTGYNNLGGMVIQSLIKATGTVTVQSVQLPSNPNAAYFPPLR